MSQLLVSIEQPSKILEVETSLSTLMGYLPQYLIGQSFRNFLGPLTNKDTIGRAIESAALRNTLSECQETLYELGGQARQMIISFSPCLYKAGRPACCLITLTESDSDSLPSVGLLDSDTRAGPSVARPPRARAVRVGPGGPAPPGIRLP